MILKQRIVREKKILKLSIKSWAWPHLWGNHMEERPRDLTTPWNQAPNLWSSLESIWKWCKASKDGVVALKLEKRYAECAVFPPSPATEGAAHCYSPQPTPGWLWACQWKSLPTAGAFQINGSNLAKLQLQLKQWGRMIPATKQADQRRKKLSTGDDEQVGRSNRSISKRKVNRALHSLEQFLGGATGAAPNLMLALYL